MVVLVVTPLLSSTMACCAASVGTALGAVVGVGAAMVGWTGCVGWAAMGCCCATAGAVVGWAIGLTTPPSGCRLGMLHAASMATRAATIRKRTVAVFILIAPLRYYTSLRIGVGWAGMLGTTASSS